MRTLLTCLAILGASAYGLLFVLFVADSRRLHGDALNGSREDGRYFVREHGTRTEVSEDDWLRNRALGIAMFASLPLALAGGGYLMFSHAFRRAIYLRRAEEVAEAEVKVRGTGTPIAETRTAGRLAWVGFGGRFLRVAVHTGGLCVKPIFLPAFGIERERIRGVRRRTIWRFEQLEIEHDSPDVRSPILLDGRQDPSFVAALEHLAGRRGPQRGS